MTPKLTSRKFNNLLKIKIFFRFIFLTRTWNNGMMEYWNADFKKMRFLYLILVKRNFTITHFPIFSLSRRLSEPEAQSPIFQCSNIPSFQLWAKRTMLNIFSIPKSFHAVKTTGFSVNCVWLLDHHFLRQTQIIISFHVFIQHDLAENGYRLRSNWVSGNSK